MLPNIGDLILQGSPEKGTFGMVVSFNHYYSSYGIEWLTKSVVGANITPATAANYRKNYLDFRKKLK